MLDVDRLFLDDPALWSIYDAARAGGSGPEDEASLKRQTMLYLHFNVFQTVHEFYRTLPLPTSSDRTNWEAWERYLVQLLRESSEAKALFQEPRTQEIYSPEFVSFVNDRISALESGAAPPYSGGPFAGRRSTVLPLRHAAR